jgi:predicted nucleotide-binding protein
MKVSLKEQVIALINESNSIATEAAAYYWSLEAAAMLKTAFDDVTAAEFSSIKQSTYLLTMKMQRGMLRGLLAKTNDESEENVSRLGSLVPKREFGRGVTGGAEDQLPQKVFIVHGHDDGAKYEVARFIDNAGFDAIILHEQVNEGKTIIEKFEKNSAVHYAVVLITPDDVGAMISKRDQLRARPRQNVILELGFFVGTLGRDHVCVLQKGDIETPSDYLGVVYIPLDTEGAWKTALAREMKKAGFKIDLNELI